MDFIYLYIPLISFMATLVRSTFGFGESLVAVPLFIFFLPVETAVPLSVLLSILIALIVVVQDHSQIHFNSAKWLILCALPGIPIGLVMLVYGSESVIKMCLGILIILYSLYSLFGKRSLHGSHYPKRWLIICGFLSGILGGAYGLNGPPLVVYGHLKRWSAKHFRATLQAYFLPASLIGVIGYAVKGLLTPTVFFYFLIALPAAVPAVFLGRYLNHQLKDDSFFKYVYGGLALIGLLLVFQSLK